MITIQDVEHVAKLSRLALTQQEKQTFARQLDNIIDHFNQLQNIDTSKVEPLAHPLPIDNVMRPDITVPPPGSQTLLSTAPAAENGFFRVPKIGEL
jgi:aspartyl-tRNA(Asn)/glutamyl-tRNA(Gln) amidotransferase subunit C